VMLKLSQFVFVVLCAVVVWEAGAQRCYESNQEYKYKIISSGCDVKIKPKECLGDGVTDAEKQEEYEAAWDGSVVYESDMQCNMTAHLFCGEGKVKEDYTKCSSQFCDVMRDDSEAGKNALECEEDADCNADGTKKVEKRVCIKVVEDRLKKMCDLTDTERAAQLDRLELTGIYGNLPSEDDCAEPDSDRVCFDRDTTTACRRIHRSTSPAEAYEACFGHSSSAVAERVLMRHLRANDWVLSAQPQGKGLFFDRVVVNEHVQNPELRSRTITVFYNTGFLSVTPDHVMPIDGSMQPARAAAVGMKLLSPSGEPLSITRIESNIGGIINPITSTGSILAASTQGAPIVASTYSAWTASIMAMHPLPCSLINVLARALPATAQSFHDTILDPFVTSSPLPALLAPLPAPLAIASWVLCDCAISVALLLFFLCAQTLGVLAPASSSPFLLLACCVVYAAVLAARAKRTVAVE